MHRLLFFLIIVGVAITLFGSSAFAQQPLDDRMLGEVVNQRLALHESPQITVGKTPTAIDITTADYYPRYPLVYVVNYGSDTVSVISTENNTVIKDIPVGKRPVNIAVNNILNRVYVVNQDSDTVSVISTENNTVIKDIPVGDAPLNIAVGGRGYLYVLYGGANQNVSIISETNNTSIDIPVGKQPAGLVVYDDLVYIANSGSGTISIIYAVNNTKLAKDIPVGRDPKDIAVYENDNWYAVYVSRSGYVSRLLLNVTDFRAGIFNYETIDIPVGFTPKHLVAGTYENKVYALNYGNNSITVIDPYGDKRIKDIDIGKSPYHSLYAVNMTLAPGDGLFVTQYSDCDLYPCNDFYVPSSVAEISTYNNTLVRKIPVGRVPVSIAVDESADSLYVTNSDSNGVSVINGRTGEVVAGVTFHVEPINSGRILCDGLTTASPTEQYVYVSSGTQCIARPNEGFEFSSWEENLKGNATQLINVSRSVSSWDSFVLAVTDFFGDKPDEPESKLNITKFGTFTANFREAPPPLPPEFWAQMYAVIATVITALFIPSIVGWIRSKRDVKKLNYYHKEIASLYDDGKLDENDMKALDQLRYRVLDAYSEGKINEKHYESLRSEISTLYEEIFRKKINALTISNAPASKKTTEEQYTKIINDVEHAYSEGKINEKHYELLTKAISNVDNKQKDTS